MTKFMAGITFALSALSLYQDILGVDRYVAVVRAGWISAYATVPTAICCIAVSLMAFYLKEK